MTVYALIPCTKSKADHPCSAREMYWPSAMFRGAWRVAEGNEQQPLILSAKYGLLRPGHSIAPYDETLIGKRKSERDRWAQDVLASFMHGYLHQGDVIVSYLGAVYAETIVPALRRWGYTVEEPLKGMGQGKRLKWFKEWGTE